MLEPRLRLRLAVLALDAAHDLGDRVDVEPAALVDGVAAEVAAVDDLGAALDDEVARDVAEDVDAAAVLDGKVSVDRAADVELAALDDAHVAADRAPERVGLEDELVAAELAALFSHLQRRGEEGNRGRGDRGYVPSSP